MKLKFGRILLVLVFIIIKSNNCISATDNFNNQLKLMPIISNDTINAFVKKYSKDSLINRIDNTIKNAVLWMNGNVQYMNNASEINKLYAISKKFKLGFDTLYIPQYKVNESIYQLYEFKEGAILQNSKILDSLKKANANIQQLMFDNIDYEMSRNSSVVLLDTSANINTAYFDTIYAKYFDVNSKDFIQAYWIFTQFAINFPKQSKVPITYKNKVFSKLYKMYNLTKVASNYNQQLIKNSTQNIFNIQQPIVVLAYGLYGGNITLKNNGADLFYLLQTINNKGNAWQENIDILLNNDIKTTMYAIWCLCQFKNQLQNFDVTKSPIINK